MRAWSAKPFVSVLVVKDDGEGDVIAVRSQAMPWVEADQLVAAE